MAFLWVFGFICLVAAYLFSLAFLISSFQIMGNHLVWFQLPHFRDKQAWTISDILQSCGSRSLVSWAVHHIIYSIQGSRMEGLTYKCLQLSYVSVCLLDQSLEYSLAILANQVSYLQTWLKFLLFENIVLTLTAPGITAEEPWPCWKPLHAKWDLIFPKYLGEEK